MRIGSLGSSGWLWKKTEYFTKASRTYGRSFSFVYTRESEAIALDLAEHYDGLYRYCYLRLRNAQMAEDVTQEACLRFYERYSALSGKQALACLYTIARNLCIDVYRTRPTEPLPEEIVGEAPGEERLLRQIAAQSALQRLSDEDRECLYLRYASDVPVAVLAQMWGLSRFACYRRVRRAERRFREELRREGFGEQER